VAPVAIREIGLSRRRLANHSLTAEERRQILALPAKTPQEAARLLKIGLETYWALTSPEGMVTLPVVERVRSRLTEITGQPSPPSG